MRGVSKVVGLDESERIPYEFGSNSLNLPKKMFTPPESGPSPSTYAVVGAKSLDIQWSMIYFKKKFKVVESGSAEGS